MNDQVTLKETQTILELAQQCLRADGDYIELGCYRGGTSLLLGKLLRSYSSNITATPTHAKATLATASLPVEAPTSKRLWIYDSFAGLPAKTPEDHSGAGTNFQAGELLVSKREVTEKLRRAGLCNVIVKKAWFDQLTAADLPAQIAFAFLDGDLYCSIKTSLKLVVPRLAQGGIIVVHDYNNPELPGSARAVDEFLYGHPEFKLQIRQSLAILQSKC